MALDQALEAVRPALDVTLALLGREEARVPHDHASRVIRRRLERDLDVGGVLLPRPAPLQPQTERRLDGEHPALHREVGDGRANRPPTLQLRLDQRLGLEPGWPDPLDEGRGIREVGPDRVDGCLNQRLFGELVHGGNRIGGVARSGVLRRVRAFRLRAARLAQRPRVKCCCGHPTAGFSVGRNSILYRGILGCIQVLGIVRSHPRTRRTDAQRRDPP